MDSRSASARAPRWLWIVTGVVAGLVAAVAALGVRELLDSNDDEPEALLDFVSLFVVVTALPSLGTLLVATGFRRRPRHVVVPLLATSLAFGLLFFAPWVTAVAAVLGGDEPGPPYDAAAADESDEAAVRPVVVYTYDPTASPSAPALRPHRTPFDGRASEQYRVDAAVNELIGSPAPRGRRTYWSLPCTRTYTGTVRVGVDAVEIDLLGPPRPATSDCRLTTRERRIREQQLAWTVRANLDDPARLLEVREPGAAATTVLTADPAFVEHR